MRSERDTQGVNDEKRNRIIKQMEREAREIRRR